MPTQQPKKPDSAFATLEKEIARLDVEIATASIDFANPKARQQFRDVCLNKIKTDKSGNYFETDRGRVSVEEFIKRELEEAPFLLASHGSASAGASVTTKPKGPRRFPIQDMPTTEYLKLSQEQKSKMLQEACSAIINRE
jgi:hypothetical protein